MADDQQPPQQRFWFPWGAVAPPPAPAPRPAGRPQLPRRDTRPAPPPQPATASPSRRQSHTPPGPTPGSRGAGVRSPPAPAQPQPTRLSSRPAPTPSRAPPLSPIREPNARAAPAPAAEPVPVAKEDKPLLKPATSPLHPAAVHDVPKQKDIIVPQEKTIHEPPAAGSSKVLQSKAREKEKEEMEEKHKDKEKKEKEKEHKDKKEKEKDHKEEKEHKDKKEKEKDHREEKDHKDKKEKEKEHKEKKEEHGSKLHKELKAGVADMVHKLSSSAPSPGGNERPTSGAAGTTVITLAGENKGASMKVNRSAMAGGKADSKDKERYGHKLDGSVVVSGKEQAGEKGLTAFVNSNVQVLNNSLLLQSSCNGRDPGVHLKLSTKSKKKGDDGEETAGGKSGSAAASKK